MFVSCISVKLVKTQIYVAITAFCGFSEKLPADRIFAGISMRKVVFQSLLNFTHIIQWLLFVPNPDVVAYYVTGRFQNAGLDHPKNWRDAPYDLR